MLDASYQGGFAGGNLEVPTSASLLPGIRLATTRRPVKRTDVHHIALVLNDQKEVNIGQNQITVPFIWTFWDVKPTKLHGNGRMLARGEQHSMFAFWVVSSHLVGERWVMGDEQNLMIIY